MMYFNSWIIEHETLLRLAVYLGVLSLMMLLELRYPRRPLQWTRKQRWPGNLLITVVNSVLLRTLLPIAAVELAVQCQNQQVGLFNRIHEFGAATKISPLWITILSIILLDLIIYWQHRLMHKLPLLWRLHCVHHADPDYDVTTGSRFHPLEIIFSMLIKLSVIALLGVTPLAVILFEVLLNAMAMFNHSNIRLPDRQDKILRHLIVTPDMHRVHHSSIIQESNRNFGFNLSLWDKLFNSYQAQPKHGHQKMNIGLQNIPGNQGLGLFKLLLIPFKRYRN